MSKLLVAVLVAGPLVAVAMLAEAQPSKPMRPTKVPSQQPLKPATPVTPLSPLKPATPAQPTQPVQVAPPKVDKQAVMPKHQSRVNHCPVPANVSPQHCFLGDECVVADVKKPGYFNCRPNPKSAVQTNYGPMKEYIAAATCGADNTCKGAEVCMHGKCVPHANKFPALRCGEGYCLSDIKGGLACVQGACRDGTLPLEGCVEQGTQKEPCLGPSVCGRGCVPADGIHNANHWQGCDRDGDGHLNDACFDTSGGFYDDCDDTDANRYPKKGIETCAGDRADKDEDCDSYTVFSGRDPDPAADPDNDGLASNKCSNPWLDVAKIGAIPNPPSTLRMDPKTKRMSGNDCDDTKRGGECP